jgi:hypothetical protein
VWQTAVVNGAKRAARPRWLDAARHPTRRDGVVLWALLLMPWIAALVLVRRYHHLDSGTVGTLAALSVGLPTLSLTWAAYRETRRPGPSVSGPALAEVADRLAAVVRTQWLNEVEARRMNDPWPLPVSWTAADPSLTDAWDSLVRLATSGVGWPVPSPATWASGPGDLAGTDDELAEVLARVPTGRLVVLGEPGAGKTILTVRLVLALLARRAPGGPVPFLAPVASWVPSREDLRSWLAARLVIDYPALAAPPPAGGPEPTQAAALLASGLILPVLDGLDEIPDEVLRDKAIGGINVALQPGQPLVVTCRTEQYRAAVRPPEGPEVTLRAAAAVQLCPLDAGAVRKYLGDDAAGPAARARWAPVFAVLGTEAPAAQALSMPLMVGLARAIYNPRPGELAGDVRDPAELCDPDLPDRTAVESLLFDEFIPAAYRHDPGGRRKAGDGEKWLVFLARHLEREIAGPDLAWWQLRRSMPSAAAGVVLLVASAIGVAAGVVAGLGMAAYIVVADARVLVSVLVGVLIWSGVTLGTDLVGRSSAEVPARGVRVTGPGGLLAAYFLAWGGLLAVVGGGSAVAVVAGLAAVAGVTAGVLAGVGVKSVPGNLAEAAGPRAVLGHDRRVALLLTLAAGAVAGAMVGIIGAYGAGLATGIAVGVLAGAGVGFGLSARKTAWPSYLLTIGWLAASRQLPRSLMGFLADAHQRGVLRKVGAVYQFRHIDLQHRLATRR